MNKLKKSMSVLLTLVMLFTTLCFFVIPETKVDANAATSTATYAGYEYFYPSGTQFAVEFAVSGRSSNKSEGRKDITKNGYTLFDHDLNAGAGGWYVYMGYKKGTTESSAIRAIGYYNGGSRPETLTYNGCVYKRVNKGWEKGSSATYVDLNRGISGSDDITLYYTTDPKAGAPLTGLDLSSSATANIGKPGVWIGADGTNVSVGGCADLNSGAKGDYIYTYFTQTGTAVDTSDMHSAITNAENNYIANSSRYVSVSALQTAVNNARTIANDYNADGLSCNYDQTAINNATNAINNAINALQTTVYFNGNGGNVSVASATVTIGGNSTVLYTPSATASRTCYTFKGWATSPDTTSDSTSSVNVGFNQTLYAVWQANEYDVVFDNLIDFKKWDTTTASNATFSNVTENGFTLTCDAGAGEGTSSSPYFPVTPGKQYKIDIDFEGDGWDVYIFFCDANGKWIDFADGPSNRYSSSGATGISPDNAVFTAPNKAEVVKAQIRVDANGANNTVRFENIRVTENGHVDNAVSFCPTKTFTYDGTYSALPTPTRENYRFLGWYTEPNGGGTKINSSDTVKITEKTHLYSHWTDESYNIVFDANGGTGTMDKAVAPIGVNYTLLANTFTRTGYRFLGWSTDKNATSATYSDKAAVNLSDKVATITLYAIWSANSYTLTFNSDGGSAVGSISGKYGDTYDKPSDPTKTGYTFNGWSPALPDTIPATSVTYTAIWKANEYTVMFDSNGGAGTMAGLKATYNVPCALTKNTFTREGYTFKGWAENKNGAVVYADGAEIKNLTSTANGSVTLYAVWTENSYTVTYDKNTGSGSVASQSFKFTDSVTLRENAFTKTGYHFIGWAETADGAVKYAGGETLSGALTAENGKNVTLYAVWEKNAYTVTFNKNDAAATGEMKKQTLTYDEPAMLSVLGFTKDGYSFVGWNTQSDGKGTTYDNGAEVLNLTSANNGNVTLYAVWTINTYDVTFNYKTVTGEEKSVEIKDVPYGKAFSELKNTLEGFGEFYYNGADTSPETNTKHYAFVDWDNAADTITKDVVFTAIYDAEGTKHSFELDENKSVKETCIKDGTNVYVCSDCGFSYSEAVNEIEGHNWLYEGTGKCLEVVKVVGHCSREGCNATGEVRIAPLGHNFEKVEASDPDCEKTGVVTHFRCTREDCMLHFESDADRFSKDGLKETDEAYIEKFIIPANGHKTILVEAVAPKCEEDGNIAYYTCENCDLLFKDKEGQNVITLAETVEPQTGHDYAATVTLPTCTEQGYTTYVCKNDSTHFYIENYVNASDHTKGETVIENNNPASCTENGSYDEVVYCTVCNAQLSRIPKVHTAPGHTYAKKQEIITQATCTDAGDYWDITYCSVCDTEIDRDKVTGQTLPHTYTEVIIDEAHLKAEATCNTYAVYYYDCCYCSANAKDAEDNYTFEYAEGGYDADNHVGTTTTKDEDIVAGTCNTEKTWNVVTRCDDCGEITNSVPMTGEKDENNHIGATEIRKENTVAGTCTSEETWNNVTYCLDCNNAINTQAMTGEKDPSNHSTTERVLKEEKAATCCDEGYTGNSYCKDCDKVVTYGEVIPKTKENHAGGTRIEKENIVPGTCMQEETWNYVKYCVGCGDELSSVGATGEKNSQNHTGNNTVTITNEQDATCKQERTWDEVTYCECGEKLGTVHKTGEKDADNHEGTPTKLVGFVAPTCKNKGYTGDKYYTCCNTLYESGSAIDEVAHTPDEAVKENDVPPTENEDGHYDNVIYCSVCHEEISRETITVRLEREITFVLYGKTVVVKAYLGDTVTAPEVDSYTSIDGFIHTFKSWDKPVTVVTGKTTYTAVYTQPCDYSQVDALEKTLNEVLDGNYVAADVLEKNKEQIQAVLKEIENLKVTRNTLDKASQNKVDNVAISIIGLIDIIYPDAGSTLVIQGSSMAYLGTVLDLKAIKMPLGAVLTDAVWVSSDDNVVCFANGKLYAVGVGTVTVTATRGILKASKVITIIEGGNIRGINFTAVNNASFVIEGFKTVKDSSIVYWSNDLDLRFAISVSQSYLFDDFVVYINGVQATPDANGYYVIPAGSGDARVTIVATVKDDNSEGGSQTVTKWSFWEWLMSIFRKIADFFKGIGR